MGKVFFWAGVCCRMGAARLVRAKVVWMRRRLRRLAGEYHTGRILFKDLQQAVGLFLGLPLVAPVSAVATLGAAVFGLLGFVAHDLLFAAQR